jgi:hypothetical protein
VEVCVRVCECRSCVSDLINYAAKIQDAVMKRLACVLTTRSGIVARTACGGGRRSRASCSYKAFEHFCENA